MMNKEIDKEYEKIIEKIENSHNKPSNNAIDANNNSEYDLPGMFLSATKE